MAEEGLLTQTPNVIPVDVDEHEKQVPWARLHSFVTEKASCDLIKDEFAFGRTDDCDVNVEHLTDFIQPISISKKHFLLKRTQGLWSLIDVSKNGTFINGNLVGKGCRAMLQNKDVIAVCNPQWKVYLFMNWESESDNFLPDTFRKRYVFTHSLGRGACGEVCLVYDRTTCDQFAIKKITKSKHQSRMNHPKYIQNEIRILELLSHPFIVEMYDVEETDEHVFIVLEYINGGELTDHIKNGMNENTVRQLFYQIVLGVQYLHENGIIHRDLKPENILLSGINKNTIIKISDFGLSKWLDEISLMETVCGSPYYVAPEILDNRITHYTKQIDIWSLGVILFYMLSKELPFQSSRRNILRTLIITGAICWSPQWQNISKQAQDLCKRMLVVDPKARLTIDEILAHPWIVNDISMKERVANMLNTSFTGSPPSKRVRIES